MPIRITCRVSFPSISGISRWPLLPLVASSLVGSTLMFKPIHQRTAHTEHTQKRSDTWSLLSVCHAFFFWWMKRKKKKNGYTRESWDFFSAVDVAVPEKKKNSLSIPNRDRRLCRHVPLLKISSSSSSRWVSSHKEIKRDERLSKLKKENERKRRKYQVAVLTMDDKFSTSLDGRRRRGPVAQIIAIAAVVTRRWNHYGIERRADQFGVVILGRRRQLQRARRVASVHRYLKCARRKKNEWNGWLHSRQVHLIT